MSTPTPGLIVVDVTAQFGADLGAARATVSAGVLAAAKRQDWEAVLALGGQIAKAAIIPDPRHRRTQLSGNAELVDVGGRMFVVLSGPELEGVPTIVVASPLEISLLGGLDAGITIFVRAPKKPSGGLLQ